MIDLAQILESKRREVAALAPGGADRPAGDAPRDFAAALAPGARPRIVAEVKRKSPSGGALAPGLDPVALARAYEAAGASAISVLTDGPFFGGSLDDLRAVRAAVKLPVLRKDFLVHESQLAESSRAGADAVLLIASALPGGELRALYAAARSLRLHVLVEVHDAGELERSAAIGAELVGINNRDLRTMQVDLATSERLLPFAPRAAWVVVESGVRGPQDVARLWAAGARAFLIGETLVKARDPGAALRQLLEAAP